MREFTGMRIAISRDMTTPQNKPIELAHSAIQSERSTQRTRSPGRNAWWHAFRIGAYAAALSSFAACAAPLAAPTSEEKGLCMLGYGWCDEEAPADTETDPADGPQPEFNWDVIYLPPAAPEEALLFPEALADPTQWTTSITVLAKNETATDRHGDPDPYVVVSGPHFAFDVSAGHRNEISVELNTGVRGDYGFSLSYFGYSSDDELLALEIAGLINRIEHQLWRGFITGLRIKPRDYEIAIAERDFNSEDGYLNFDYNDRYDFHPATHGFRHFIAPAIVNAELLEVGSEHEITMTITCNGGACQHNMERDRRHPPELVHRPSFCTGTYDGERAIGCRGIRGERLVNN